VYGGVAIFFDSEVIAIDHPGMAWVPGGIQGVH
jgi:hypothetical protein